MLRMSVPHPMFENPVYIVPEDDPGSIPLCVNISVQITEPITYTVESLHMFPAETEGKEIDIYL